jgi:DNA-binding beta-propeller fold protein YncE
MVCDARFRPLSAVLLLSLLFSIPQQAHAGPPPSNWMFQGLVQTLNTGDRITLSPPTGMVLDAAGDVFVLDAGNSRIVEVNAQGTASVLAIIGLSPALASPVGIAIDGSGNLYAADTGNNRVVEVSSAGAGSVMERRRWVRSRYRAVRRSLPLRL